MPITLEDYGSRIQWPENLPEFVYTVEMFLEAIRQGWGTTDFHATFLNTLLNAKILCYSPSEQKEYQTYRNVLDSLCLKYNV